MTASRPAPLTGLRVFDLTRILAGPTATQLLGDLGADIVKIERPGQGDDTRKWGPPFVEEREAEGDHPRTAAYYLSANRNKRSLTIDIASEEGQALARKLAAECDIFVENFKVGGLQKYGLDYESIRQVRPDIIYCSITGFGQTGPYAPRAGYDYLAQGMGGLMSLTGEPEGEPIKVGVGIADVMCGMYAVAAILSALHHRHRTGEGQYIDLALLDSQVAWLVNEGLNYLTSGELPKRLGNEHPNIVPYKVLPCADGFFILAVGNDAQFRRFCGFAGRPDLPDEPRFATNYQRVTHRRALYEILEALGPAKTLDEWVEGLSELSVPCGPVNTLDRVFADPQIRHRGMKLRMEDAQTLKGHVDLIANPIKFSTTPVSYRYPPPRMGEHTEELLKEILDLPDAEIARLRASGAI